MSERLGPRTLGHKQEQVFLGRDFSTEPNYSDRIAYEIDLEVRRLVDEAHDRAKEILTKNRDRLDVIARILVDKETIAKEKLLRLLEDDPKGLWESHEKEKEKERWEEEKNLQEETGKKHRGLGRNRQKPVGQPEVQTE